MTLPVPFCVTEWEKEWYTEDEYFAWEDHSPVRWEFRPVQRLGPSGRPFGVIHAMPGGTVEHSGIAGRLCTALMNALDKTDEQVCQVFNCLLKFHTPDGRNTYPDISIVRGKAVYHRERDDILTNPVLLAEVLSPASEAYDRGDKWASYQTIPTLQYFLLLASDRARVEVYTREETDWHFAAWEGAETQVPLPALGITLALAYLYERIDFEQGG